MQHSRIGSFPIVTQRQDRASLAGLMSTRPKLDTQPFILGTFIHRQKLSQIASNTVNYRQSKQTQLANQVSTLIQIAQATQIKYTHSTLISTRIEYITVQHNTTQQCTLQHSTVLQYIIEIGFGLIRGGFLRYRTRRRSMKQNKEEIC